VTISSSPRVPGELVPVRAGRRGVLPIVASHLATSRPFDSSGNRIAANQLRVALSAWGPPPANPRQYQGLGTLLATICPEPRIFYCRGEDSGNLDEELPRFGTEAHAYGS